MIFKGYSIKKDVWVDLEFNNIYQAKLKNPELIKIHKKK